MSTPASPRSPVRVGTWNVEFAKGPEKNRRRLEILTERDCDIWVLTETNDDLALPHPYGSVSTEDRHGPDNGGRWTTIWTRFEIAERIATTDPSRTACARVVTTTGLSIVVYGTVLPWHADGLHDDPPKTNWSEFDRVVDEQAGEWRSLRARYPDALLVVAGDLNHNLGGPHYYGTKNGRAQLRKALASADLDCLTETERIPTGQLDFPPIDHVCAAPPTGHTLRARAEGWPKTTPDGVVLTDHSGVVATITVD